MKTSRTKSALLPEDDLEVDTYVELLRTHEALAGRFRELFKRLGLTMQQYNVLRILYVRDDTGEGLACQEIRDRLVHRVPDITRLLDRLEGAGWVERERSEEDRRVVRTRLTEAGLAKVEAVHPHLMEIHGKVFRHMKKAELRELRTLLQRAREASS